MPRPPKRHPSKPAPGHSAAGYTPPKLKAFLDVPKGQKPTQRNSRMMFCRGKRCVQPDKDTRDVHCQDCVEGNPEETLGELMDRMERGNG